MMRYDAQDPGVDNFDGKFCMHEDVTTSRPAARDVLGRRVETQAVFRLNGFGLLEYGRFSALP
jgi:hypothetical protein